MDFNFKIPLGGYTNTSVKELRAFLSCTHRRTGEGSLPWRLAQRGPQLLLLISEFLLEPKVVLYAGCEDGRIKALELEPLPGNASRIREVESVAAPQKAHVPNAGLLIGASGQQRVSGLAVGNGCLFAAMSSGTLRVFALPSLEEQVSVALRVLLPPQSPVIVDWCGLVASRRSLYVVDLRCGSVVREMPLLFAARPCIIAEGASVFVQCDEAIRVWDRSALLPHAGATVGKLESQDFWKPHEQMLVGMAVLPGGHFVATACPREIRGWAWPGDRKGTAPYLLWTVSTLPPNVGGTCCEVTSLLWLPSPVTAGRLAVFGECDGSLVICELQLCASFGDAPGLASAFHLPGASQAATAVPPKSRSGELTVWSEAGWFSFFGGQLRASIEESGAMDAISSTCYGPLAALPRFF